MLPKVANQLLHHTSRAVAAVQNQTGHTIRNVLHIQSTPTTVANRNGTGSSSSGRGSSGAGAGGARQSGSSRFHSPYSALSRSVTQADPSALHSTTIEAADEGDDVVNATPSAVASRRLRQRTRSGSSALSTYDRESLQKSGLLYALQQHARSIHAFAVPPSTRVAESSSKDADQTPSQVVEDADASGRDEKEEQLIASLRDAKVSNDRARVLAIVEDVRLSESPCSTSLYNAALDALYRTHNNGEPLVTLLELYNDMVSRSVLPNGATYSILISALSDRDIEADATASRIKERARRLLHIKKYREELRREDESLLMRLRQENNLQSALVLFQAGCLLRGHSFSHGIYHALLRSCAVAGNVDAALRVFGHLEKRVTPQIVAYRYLLEAHSKSGDLAGAKEIFSAYLEIAKSGHVERDAQSDVPSWRSNHVAVYNEMIRSYIYHGQAAEALGVLEQMLGPEASSECELGQIPSPSPSTFTGIINGFIRTGDIDSAFTWFNRLLQEPSLPEDPLVPAPRPTKPTASAWQSMITALAYSDRVEDLGQIVDAASRDKLYDIDNTDRFLYVFTVLRHLERPDKLDRAVLDRLVDTHVYALNPYVADRTTGQPLDVASDVIGVHLTLMKLYVSLGDHESAVANLERFIGGILKDSLAGEQDGTLGSEIVMVRKKSLRILLVNGTTHFWFGPDRPLSHSLRLATLCYDLDMRPHQPTAGYYVKSYVQASEEEKNLLTQLQWELVVHAAGSSMRQGWIEHVDYFKQHSAVNLPSLDLPAEFDIMALATDIHKRGIDLVELHRSVKIVLGQCLVHVYGEEGALSRLRALDPSYSDILVNVVKGPDSRVHLPAGKVNELPMGLPETAPTASIRLDAQFSRFVDEWYAKAPKEVTPQHGYQRFKAGAEMGQYPRPEVIGRLIAAMGRAGELDKLHELYQSAQLVLSVLEDEKQSQSLGWFLIEDQMIIGLAHAGQVEAAHVHRARILEHGGSPSADAYGALIENVTDTTDDTTNALALFEECKSRGVTPNIYLYNTIISKLAKARKADYAIQLFQLMKSEHIRPTSVTYGALIAACCRVGDAISAETLFNEMTAQKNFKPRIPPYNTMMQLYTHTKPDRERVLHFFNEMRKAGVKPTAHTYKLLMDAYGTIEPIDTDAMQQAFDTLVADRQVPVQGTHWAALINAWGCAKKDLNQAIKIFESIRNHPSQQKVTTRLPDAVVFEALINVFVTLRHPELIAEYRARIPELGIRMTAYIANLLIKGYAAAGDIVEARNIFESLSDPPEGIAAPFNHAPHGDQPSSPTNHLNLPDGAVYREPSTWEAMVRAELGHGNREQAIALLERVRARRFPPAVFHRISGIMLDDSVSPWGRGSEASAPSTP